MPRTRRQMSRTRSLIIASEGDLEVHRDPQRVSGRLLRQDGMDASYIDLADAGHLEFDYLRWSRVVLRAFGATRVLHLGGGACALARALLAEDCESRHEVVEVDARVFEIARAHMGLRRQPGLKLRVGDGRAVLEAQRLRASVGQRRDAIVIDAFVAALVPRHLVTREALGACAEVAPLTVVNVVDTAGLPDTRRIAAGLAEAYTLVGALAGSHRAAGNIVLFASSAEPPHVRIERQAAADRTPARLLAPSQLAGAGMWRDPATSAPADC